MFASRSVASMLYSVAIGESFHEGKRVPVNRKHPERWQEDIRRSVRQYNDWYMKKGPEIFDGVREGVAARVDEAFEATSDFAEITAATIRSAPGILQILRFSTSPPLARDRLIGLAGVKPSLVKALEGTEDEEGNLRVSRQIPRTLLRTGPEAMDQELTKIAAVINELLDFTLFPWLGGEGRLATETERHRSSAEEVTKVTKLRRSYGEAVRLVLFLRGYFDEGYLKYSARDNIDWVWEHRIGDLAYFGL